MVKKNKKVWVYSPAKPPSPNEVTNNDRAAQAEPERLLSQRQSLVQ